MSSKGTSKFKAQRFSAIVLIPLVMWFLFSLLSRVGAPYLDMKNWLAHPLNAIPMALLIIVGAFHMRIGMSEIIEDYIHSGLRPVLLLLNWVFAIGVVLVAAGSVITLAFT